MYVITTKHVLAITSTCTITTNTRTQYSYVCIRTVYLFVSTVLYTQTYTYIFISHKHYGCVCFHLVTGSWINFVFAKIFYFFFLFTFIFIACLFLNVCISCVVIIKKIIKQIFTIAVGFRFKLFSYNRCRRQKRVLATL